MLPIFNVATVALCTGLMTFVVALVLTYALVYEKREKAIAWWSLAMWCFTVGLALFLFRKSEFRTLVLDFSSAFMCLGCACVWAGFAKFSGKPVSWLALLFAPAAWLIFMQIPVLSADLNNRIIVLSAICSIYSLLSAVAAEAAWRLEELPSAKLTAYFYAVHTLTLFVRIPMAILYPIDETKLISGTSWMFYANMEGFVQSIFTAFVCFLLVRERSERRYRLAAEVDGLTEASSRRYFVEKVSRNLAKRPAEGVLAILDLDHFKGINDTCGHLAGDKVLKEFATLVRRHLQPGMSFGRLGGEEFGLFLPDMDEEQSFELLETIRKHLANRTIAFNGSELKVTVSIGAASISALDAEFDHLLAGADNALYLSKDMGRDRTSFFRAQQRLHPIVENGQPTRLSLQGKRVSRLAVRTRFGAKQSR